MNSSLSIFLDASNYWVCDDYSIDLRFIAEKTDQGLEIWDASIILNPLPSQQDISFRVDASEFTICQSQKICKNKEEAFNVLSDAAHGKICIGKEVAKLPVAQAPDYYSEMVQRDRWFCDLHLQVNGSMQAVYSPARLAQVDSALRQSEPPFDGLNDSAHWLGLRSPWSMTGLSSINIRITPPVDINFEKSELVNDELHLTLNAHPKFNVKEVGVAVRAVPGDGLNARKQVASEIQWRDGSNGLIEGVAKISLKNADQALLMLMIGPLTVRRHWFLDPMKARNNRFISMSYFDKELKQVRQAALGSLESVKFEKGVASLLYMLGFNPVLPLETDAPDLIVMTPNGRMLVVECTTKISDFGAKLGKLVDRRRGLIKHLTLSGHPSDVSAVLVCQLPRDQIAAKKDELRDHNTILVSAEDLAEGFERLRYLNDPEKLLDDALARLSQSAIAQ